MAAMGGMAMGGAPLPPAGDPMGGMVDPMGGMGAPPMAPPMTGPPLPEGPVPPPTSTPLNGAGAAPGTAVDLGGMGAPPVMAPDSDDLIMSALQAVLGKWAANPQIAGEKNELLSTLMTLAATQPPMPQEAFVEGGIPTNFGVAPDELNNPMNMNGPTY